jgi:hypothetical protein
MLLASIPNVSSAFSDVCCKCAYLDVAYVSHICCKSMFEMFQLFQFLCCSKCFHVASCKYFIYMLHMFHTHIVSVCSKYFICFRFIMLHSSVLCCKCFVFERYVRRVMGHSLDAGEAVRQAEGRRMGRVALLGSCGRGILVLIPGPARAERDEGVRGKGTRAWRDKADKDGL